MHIGTVVYITLYKRYAMLNLIILRRQQSEYKGTPDEYNIAYGYKYFVILYTIIFNENCGGNNKIYQLELRIWTI